MKQRVLCKGRQDQLTVSQTTLKRAKAKRNKVRDEREAFNRYL